MIIVEVVILCRAGEEVSKSEDVVSPSVEESGKEVWTVSLRFTSNLRFLLFLQCKEET